MRRWVWVVVMVLSLGLAPLATPVRAAGALRPAADSIYIVQPGDSLWRIATRNNTTVAALVAANGFANDAVMIHPGQQLIIPGAGGSVTTASAPPTGAGGAYVVQASDSLWRIATRNNTTVAALVAANGFANDKVMLHPGQVLTLPGGAGGTAQQTTAPAAQPAATAPGINHLGTETANSCASCARARRPMGGG